MSHAPLLAFAPRKCVLSVYLIDGVGRHAADLAALGRVLAASVRNARRMNPDRPPDQWPERGGTRPHLGVGR